MQTDYSEQPQNQEHQRRQDGTQEDAELQDYEDYFNQNTWAKLN